jgi:tetratricopeptide (TPR) repeat protein
VYRLLAMTVVPCAMFLLLELTLCLFGYGYPAHFFVDGYSPGRHEDVYIENIAFGKRFFRPGLVRKPFPVLLPRIKSPGTCRVFVLGESAAMGFPDPPVSFGRVLEVLLQQAYPERNFEVINTAMTAINSHAVLSIARDCARLKPDVFVVLLGNNEVVGPFGAAGVVNAQAGNLQIVRANLFVQSTRSGQLLGHLMRSLKPVATESSWTGMALFAGSQVRHDDPRLAGTYDNFRQNLRDICHTGVDAGAKVVVCTVPVNLQDCPPFAAVHDPQLSDEQIAAFDWVYQQGVHAEAAGKSAEALERYDAAAGIDADYADLVYRRARCHAGLGHAEEAAKDYARARDLDALRFRSDSKINQTIHEVAGGMAAAGVHLVDAEKEFASTCPSGVPGEALFLEHVHMTFHGNYVLAASVFRTLGPLLAGASADTDPLTERACAERLAYCAWSRFKSDMLIHSMAVDPPFNQQIDAGPRAARLAARVASWRGRADRAKLEETRQLFKTAMERVPMDWILRERRAQFLADAGDLQQALAQYGMVLDDVPHHAQAASQMASLWLDTGRPDEAKRWYQIALKVDPDFTNAHYEYAKILALEGREEEGIAYFAARVNVEPDRVEALTQFANFLLNRNRLADARSRLEQAFALNPAASGAHMVMGHLLVREGSVAEALTHYEAAATTRPSLAPEVTRIRAELKQRAGAQSD